MLGIVVAATQPSAGPDAAPQPAFRRARPEDAVDQASATFLDGSRVDMQTLAARLGISPATLYRWFGSRAGLLEEVFERIAEEFAARARAEAQGQGDDLVCDYARRMMTMAAAFEPMRIFVTREPQLGLRLLLSRGGAVHRVVTARTGELIAQTRGPGARTPDEEHVHLIVQVATALEWATFTVGDEPQIDSAVEIIRMILAAPPPATSAT
jgi:AcrR family transcriptional regulator